VYIYITVYNTKQWRSKWTGVQEIIFHFRLFPRESHTTTTAAVSGRRGKQPVWDTAEAREADNVSSSEYEIEPCISAVQTNNGLGCRYYYYYIIGAIHLCFYGIRYNIYSDNTPQCRTIYRRSFIIFRSYISSSPACVYCTCEWCIYILTILKTIVNILFSASGLFLLQSCNDGKHEPPISPENRFC